MKTIKLSDNNYNALVKFAKSENKSISEVADYIITSFFNKTGNSIAPKLRYCLWNYYKWVKKEGFWDRVKVECPILETFPELSSKPKDLLHFCKECRIREYYEKIRQQNREQTKNRKLCLECKEHYVYEDSDFCYGCLFSR
ncbi:MAG: hypothetical protein QXX95_02015 [Nitrososphaerales archaeon]